MMAELQNLWGNLSKEELMAKVIAFEASKLNLQNEESLNVNHGKDYGGNFRGGKKGGNRSGKPGGGGPSFKAKRKPFKHGHNRPNAKRKKK